MIDKEYHDRIVTLEKVVLQMQKDYIETNKRLLSAQDHLKDVVNSVNKLCGVVSNLLDDIKG